METSYSYIIAGASSGIGLELAKKCIESGNHIYGLSRTAGPLISSSSYTHIPFDFLSDNKLPEISQKVNGLIYCPGTINLKPLQRLSSEDILKDFTLNAKAAFLFVQHYLSNIKNSKNASVILFSSVAVQSGMPFHCSVAMAKGAVEGLTKALAAELAPEIRVNAIAPSLTDTPLAAYLLSNEAKLQASKERHPLKDIGSANEIASFAYHLLTEAKWATGQIFGINGGLGTIIK